MNIKDLQRGDLVVAYNKTEREWIRALVVRTYESGGSPGARVVGVTLSGEVADFHVNTNANVQMVLKDEG